MGCERSIIRNAAIIFTLCFVATLWVIQGAPSTAKLALYISERMYVAFICCVALFVLKGFVPFIPTAVIYFICGCLLPIRYALIVCLAGSAYIFTAAYCAGKKARPATFPDTGMLTVCDGGFLPALFLHSIRLVPCGTAGYYLGRIGAPYIGCLLGTFIGLIPSILLTLTIANKA